MKARAAVVIIQDGCIALVERYRQGRHYLTFPGGKVKPGESPAEAAARESLEELGLVVEIGPMVAEIWYMDTPQYYFLARPTGGKFGSGAGDELTSSPGSEKGTYLPIWMKLTQVPKQPLVPHIMALSVIQSQRSGWPEEPLVIKSQPPDDMTEAEI